MTTIKSIYAAGWTLTVTSEKAGETRIKIRTARGETPSVAVSTVELHAALGIDELGCGCDEADTNLKKALARAEDAEAEALEQAKLVRTWADRAEKAEATIERVREIAENSYNSSWLALKGICAALDPKPAFVLPTRVPARIEAKRDYHGWAGELELWSNGEQQRFWRCEYDGQDYTPDGVMALFTEHRLVEPES